MPSGILLLARTRIRRYAVRFDDVSAVRRVSSPADAQHDDAERAPILVDLGALFDPHDLLADDYRHGLVVPIRRRQVVLLVAAVETFLDHPQVHPLPTMMQRRLQQPWAIGVLALDDTPTVVLDVRAVARSVMVSHSRADGDLKQNTSR